MSIVILIAPTAATATAAWATLRQADLADAAPSRREQLTPQQVQQLMLKTVQQRRGAALAPASTAAHAPSSTNTQTQTHTLDKIWTELAADLVLANVDAPHFGWHQTLDAHTPGFWQRFDPHTRFVLVYENPAQFVARNLVRHAPSIGNANTPDDDTTPGDNSQTLLTTWHASHSTLLDTYYALGADAVLVHADQMASTTALLGLPKPAAPSTVPAQQTVPGATLLTQLLQPLVKQDTQAHALWQELQAASQAPMAEPTPDAQTALRNLDACLQLQTGLLAAQQALDAAGQQALSLQDQLASTQQALQTEAAAKATAQKQWAASQNDNTRLAEQHRQQLRETQKEGELLLTQLHQVQEELEKYFIQHGEEQKARQQEAQAKAQAIAQRDDQAKLKTDLQAKLDAESKARQTEAQARAATQKQIDALKHETARLAEQHRLQTQELQEEGELLLTQLHQVQEELERYFLQYQDQKKQLHGITQFWLRHPPADLWVDMRRTDDGQGWYEAEADGRWSGPSTESSIELPPLAAGTYLVELHIADAMSPELVAGTQLQAQLSDGQTLPVELVHEFGAATGLYPMVSAGVLQLPDGVQGSWQLKLVLPEVISPAKQGGDDTRQLGLRLQGLRLSQQPADTPEAAT